MRYSCVEDASVGTFEKGGADFRIRKTWDQATAPPITSQLCVPGWAAQSLGACGLIYKVELISIFHKTKKYMPKLLRNFRLQLTCFSKQLRSIKGFPGGASGKGHTCQRRHHEETRVRSLGRGDPLKEGVAAHSSVLAWRVP